MWRWLLLSGVVVTLDQISKYVVVEKLANQPPVEVTSFFNLLLVYNRGAAFSFLAGAGGWQCYVVDRMPDMKAAAEWKGAVAYTTGLNEVASGSPVGTVINANYPTAGGMYGSGSSSAPILCVKN